MAESHVLLVDPFEKTAQLVPLAPGRPLIDQIRELVGCLLLTTIKPAPGVILWLDNLGLLKGEKQRFWRMRDSKIRLAGRTVLTSVDPDGMPLPVVTDVAAFLHGVDWCEDARIKRVREEIVVEHHPEMGAWPRIVPVVDWEGPEPVVEPILPYVAETPPAAVPAAPESPRAGTVYWVVFDDDATDGFLARERSIDGREGVDGTYTGQERAFETLDEVKTFAEKTGLRFELRTPDDPEGVAGTMI
jgi:hypothetical protein